MALVRVTLNSGRVVEFDDTPIGRGGEKLVFLSKDRTEVVCFYHAITDYAARRQRLERVISEYNPTTQHYGDYWQKCFCWPTDIIEPSPGLSQLFAANGLPSQTLGLTAPAYRQNFFFTDQKFNRRLEKECRWFTSPKLRRRVPSAEFGTLQTRLLICQRLARAIRRMHAAGLAHSDLSNKNVLIDPKTGEVSVIDIDMLVVPGVAPPAVLGTQGYIAPELLVSRHAQANVLTDLHSMAVLFYEILFCRHPLDGRKVHDPRDPAHDDELRFGARAIFAEDPNDTSNRPRDHITVPYTIFGENTSKLFLRAFTGGLRDPRRRPTAREWELAFARTYDLLYPALLQGEWTVVDPKQKIPHCHHTRRPLPPPVPYLHFLRSVPGQAHPVPENFGLVLYDNLILYSWHTMVHGEPDEKTNRNNVGYVSFHQGKWKLVNRSGQPMSIDGKGQIPDKTAIELTDGLVLRLGPTAQHRTAKVEFLGR